VIDQEREPVAASVHEIQMDAGDADKGPYAHFMLKEIFEQPEALENAMRGRLDDADSTTHFAPQSRSPAAAAGRAHHPDGLRHQLPRRAVGEYLFEEFARMPVEVEYASEFRYRNPPVTATPSYRITQSGETADTLAAVRESKRKGNSTLAVWQRRGSTIAREADGGVYLHAGPEIGVASTKAFTSQVCVLTMLALVLRPHCATFRACRARRCCAAARGPDAVQRALGLPRTRPANRRALRTCHNCLYLGRQYLYPVALEGALKLKEISYIHAEGYPRRR